MLNWSGDGFLNVEVEMPTTSGNTYTEQVDKFILDSTVQPEVKLFKMTKGAADDII